jgi:hypothetical protein
MEKIDSVINLLSKALDTQDLKDLSSIEEEIQNLSKSLKQDIELNQLELDKETFKKKINSLNEIILKLTNNNQVNSKIFSEFQKFVQDRKFK